jgi:hypothetical protein
MLILAEKALAGLSRILTGLLPWKKVSIDASFTLQLKWRCDAPE